MSMDMIRLRCTSCGADFENVDVQEHQRFFKCTRAGCGAVFMVDQGAKFADVEQADAEKIQKYREELKAALEPIQDDRVDFFAHEILRLVPEDFRAQALSHLVQFRRESSRGLYQFLSQPPECTEEEFADVFPILLRFCDFRALKLLRDKTVPQCVKQKEQRAEMLAQVDWQMQRLRDESDAYAEVNRDVFICHSSENGDVALQVVDALEKDGNQCWISSRNLPPEERYYWDRIEGAVSRCSIFLVVCTDDAMQSHDVQRELKFARKYNLARLELKYDTAPHTTLFKDFFDGIAWVDGTGNLEEALEALKKQVKDIRFPPDPSSPEVKVGTLTEEERQQRLERRQQEDRERIAAQEAEKERVRKEREAREKAEREKQETLQKQAADRKKPEEEEKTKQQREMARQKQLEEQAKAARIAKQKSQCRRLTLLAVLLFAGRVVATRVMGNQTAASLLAPQLISSVLYFLAVLVFERVLLRHTGKPHAAMAALLLLPLALDYWYLTPLRSYRDVDSISRGLALLKALLLLLALFFGISAKKRYEKES